VHHFENMSQLSLGIIIVAKQLFYKVFIFHHYAQVLSQFLTDVHGRFV
jgi:hypothetical protein